MTIGCGPRINRAAELKSFANAPRREIDNLLDGSGELVLVHPRSAGGIDIDRKWLGDTDRVGQLNHAFFCKAGRHNIFCHPARGVSSRPVDLGRILAGERTAAMRGSAAVSVDDDLSTGQSAIAIRAADNEAPGRVDVKFVFGHIQPSGRVFSTCGRTISRT